MNETWIQTHNFGDGPVTGLGRQSVSEFSLNGTGRTGGESIVSDVTVVTSTTQHGDSLQLPAAEAGLSVLVMNKGSHDVYVWTDSTSDSIERREQYVATTYHPIHAGMSQKFLCNGTKWLYLGKGSKWVAREPDATNPTYWDWGNVGSTLYGTLTIDATARSLPSVTNIYPESAWGGLCNIWGYMYDNTTVSEVVNFYADENGGWNGGIIHPEGRHYNQATVGNMNSWNSDVITAIHRSTGDIQYQRGAGGSTPTLYYFKILSYTVEGL